MNTALDLNSYCTHVPVVARLRLDLFTARAFRIRLSRLQGNDPFPPAYEIPFAVGKHTNWAPVPFTRTENDGEVVVTTAALRIRIAKFDFRFTVWTADGSRRICPSGGPVYGMFKDGYTLFDSASAFGEENLNDRNGHWFYNPETGRYCDTYLAPSPETSEHRNNEIHDQFFIYGPTTGTYRGVPAQRTWDLQVRGVAVPFKRVLLGTEALTRADGDASPGTWTWDAAKAALHVCGRPAAAADGLLFRIDQS
ncbi:MAG: hypothetical protein FJ222_03990 [Lentisphaerae bacterium]|nr:hypothetical protein [Lentisphaerota bacterium]